MDKVIYIIGMGPGVGAAVARRFGSEGYAVGAVARRADKPRRPRGGAARRRLASCVRYSRRRRHRFPARGLARLQAELGDATVMVYNAACMTYRALGRSQRRAVRPGPADQRRGCLHGGPVRAASHARETFGDALAHRRRLRAGADPPSWPVSGSVRPAYAISPSVCTTT